jgi:pyruvate/2-oxoglutarate dehydrogenase complex dihydrolipoamide acyltransferase (E2) component
MEPALAFVDQVREEWGVQVTVTHLVAKALAIAIARHPETNAKVRFWGKLEQRKTVDITVLLQARETDEERRVFWSELCRYSGWSGTLDSLVDHE